MDDLQSMSDAEAHAEFHNPQFVLANLSTLCQIFKYDQTVMLYAFELQQECMYNN